MTRIVNPCKIYFPQVQTNQCWAMTFGALVIFYSLSKPQHVGQGLFKTGAYTYLQDICYNTGQGASIHWISKSIADNYGYNIYIKSFIHSKVLAVSAVMGKSCCIPLKKTLVVFVCQHIHNKTLLCKKVLMQFLMQLLLSLILLGARLLLLLFFI